MKKLPELALICAALLLTSVSANGDIINFNEHMNLLTMQEAGVSLFTTVSDYAGGSSLSSIPWSGTYSAQGWSMTASGNFAGQPLSFTYSGTLSGQDGSDITVDFNGSGTFGIQPLLMSGKTTWFYDAPSQDYINYDFEQLTKIEANSWWGWINAAEIIIGVGAGVAVGTGSAALGLGPGGVVPGVKAGVAATAALVGISSGSKYLQQSPSPPPKPTKPPRPPVPVASSTLPYNGQTIISSSQIIGSLAGVDMNGSVRSSGTAANGLASGSFTSTPEPSAIILVWLGLAAMALMSRSRYSS